jgi:hypothetical protein
MEVLFLFLKRDIYFLQLMVRKEKMIYSRSLSEFYAVSKDTYRIILRRVNRLLVNRILLAYHTEEYRLQMFRSHTIFDTQVTIVLDKGE